MAGSRRFMHLPGGKQAPRAVEVEPLDDGRYRVKVGDSVFEWSALMADGRLNVIDGQRSLDLIIERRGDTILVPSDAGRASVELMDARRYESMAVLGGGVGAARPELKSPMAGKVVLVKVEVGESAAEGQTLIIIEAMKMENELRALAPVTIKDIRVKAGDVVSPGELLMTFDLGE